MFKVFYVDGTADDFNESCDNVDYSDSQMIVFKKLTGTISYITLAIVPRENILKIINILYDCD